MSLEVFVGVLAALVVDRALRFVGSELIRAWVRHDRETTLARQMSRHGSGSWTGARSFPWRVMQRLGIEEVRNA